MEAGKQKDELLDENKRRKGSSTSKYEKSCHKGHNISHISPDIQQAEITVVSLCFSSIVFLLLLNKRHMTLHVSCDDII